MPSNEGPTDNSSYTVIHLKDAAKHQIISDSENFEIETIITIDFGEERFANILAYDMDLFDPSIHFQKVAEGGNPTSILATSNLQTMTKGDPSGISFQNAKSKGSGLSIRTESTMFCTIKNISRFTLLPMNVQIPNLHDLREIE